MVGSFDFDAELRTSTGKGEARRARRQGKVPAILYGGGKDPVMLNLTHHRVAKALQNEAVYSHVLTLRFEGTEEKAVLKALERHPSRPIVMHMDFQRVDERVKLHVHIPLRFINQESSVGVKKGGVVNHALVEVEVSCLPQDLPEFIEVDMGPIDIGGAVHLSELKLPDGVEIVGSTHGGGSHDQQVAAIYSARAQDIEE